MAIYFYPAVLGKISDTKDNESARDFCVTRKIFIFNSRTYTESWPGSPTVVSSAKAFAKIGADRNQIFGPALIRAYDLENKFAKYPRLVVDPELIQEWKQNKLLRKYGHSVQQESEHISELIRQSDDGLWFVDYARAIESELNKPEMYPGFLVKHKDVIVVGSSKFKKYDKNMEKYVWLASYHNALIGEIKPKWFKHYGLKRNELLINSKEIPALQYIEP